MFRFFSDIFGKSQPQPQPQSKEEITKAQYDRLIEAIRSKNTLEAKE